MCDDNSKLGLTLIKLPLLNDNCSVQTNSTNAREYVDNFYEDLVQFNARYKPILRKKVVIVEQKSDDLEINIKVEVSRTVKQNEGDKSIKQEAKEIEHTIIDTEVRAT